MKIKMKELRIVNKKSHINARFLFLWCVQRDLNPHAVVKGHKWRNRGRSQTPSPHQIKNIKTKLSKLTPL